MLALQAAGHTVVAVAPDDAYAQRIRQAGIAFEAVPNSGGGTHPLRELEAAATARPVITTDAPRCRDTVVDGETGFLCRPADARDLTEKLLRFIALPRRNASCWVSVAARLWSRTLTSDW